MATCKPGYFGAFCNNTCPSGSYGPQCGGKCLTMCSYEECDHVYGCPVKDETSVPTATSEIFETTQSLTIWTKDKLEHPEKNTEPNKEYSTTTSGIQPMYLLVGVGVILTLFLFIAIIELCNRAKISKNKAEIEQRCNENTQSSNLCHRALTCQNKEGPSYQPNDVEYAEVNEVAEIQAANSSKTISQERPENSQVNSSFANVNSHILVEIR